VATLGNEAVGELGAGEVGENVDSAKAARLRRSCFKFSHTPSVGSGMIPPGGAGDAPIPPTAGARRGLARTRSRGCTPPTGCRQYPPGSAQTCLMERHHRDVRGAAYAVSHHVATP